MASPLAADVVLLAAVAALCLVPLASGSTGWALRPSDPETGAPGQSPVPADPAGMVEPAPADS